MDAILNSQVTNKGLYNEKEETDMGEMSLSDVAAVTGRDDFGGNSAFWIFALIALMGGGFGNWNNRGGQLATQEFVQNGFNFNDLQDQNRDLMNAITSGTAQAVRAANEAEYETIAVAKDAQYQLQQGLNNIQMLEQANQANQNKCCCETLRAIDGVNYNNAMNTQKILDKMSENEIQALRSQVANLQNQLNSVGTVKYPMASTYTAGQNPFFQCNCGGY